MDILENIIKAATSKSKKSAKIVAGRPDKDLIPYVCHYDKETIVTKNGQLIKIIRVTGLTGKNIASDLISLRDSIREAIYTNTKNNEEGFAFWFHTIRRRKSVIADSEQGFENYFCEEINNKWNQQNNFANEYVNELYISIISEGLDTPITDFTSFVRSFSYETIHKLHKNHLAQSEKRLSKLTQKIFKEIEDHGAKILRIEDYKGVLYSQQLRFLGKIVNLEEERYPLSANDMSDVLSGHKVVFGNREIEVSTKDYKNFGAMFSIKEYSEVSVESLEKIMNLPFEFIITQSFDFFYNKKELEPYEYNNFVLDISQDDTFKEISGFNDFFEDSKNAENAKNNFGKLQTTLMVINNNREKLKSDINKILERFTSLGYVMIREDVFNEHCFWSQLPGNFSFLRRQKLINTSKVPGYAALNSFPSGSIYNNHWGPAVTTFKTIINTPYFFNFHEQDLGHTLILGPKGSGKTVLTNFLVSQSKKINNRVFYFDFNSSSKVFINSLDGKYYSLKKDKEDGEELLKMNPFSLDSNQDNVMFLTFWLNQLLMVSKTEISDEEYDRAAEIIKNILNSDNPDFSYALEQFRTKETNVIYEKLKTWVDGKLSYIFGDKQEIDWGADNIGFNLDLVINQKPILLPIFLYLLYKIETTLDGKPTIIVIDEAFEFIDNEIFESLLSDTLESLRRKNCIVIFVSRCHLYIAESKIAQIIYDNVATEIYLPNSDPQDYYQDIFECEDDEIDILKYIALESRYNALIKHSPDSLIIEQDFRFLEEYRDILSCDKIAIATFEEIINALKEEGKTPRPQDWIKDFIEISKQLKEDQKKEAIKALESTTKEDEKSSNKENYDEYESEDFENLAQDYN